MADEHSFRAGREAADAASSAPGHDEVDLAEDLATAINGGSGAAVIEGERVSRARAAHPG
jgi:hypothetical protein